MSLPTPASSEPAVAAGKRSERVALAWSAAALSFSAACVHGSVMVAHFREYWLFGLFFLIVTPLQLAWAEAVRRYPERERLLAIGGAGNLAIVCVWVASRTIGLPFGPERLEAEPIGAKDLLASADEVAIATIVAWLLLRGSGAAAPRWAVAAAWTLAAVSIVGAFVGGAGH